MIKSTVSFKIKQNNGVITEYQTKDYSHTSYDAFLDETEREIERISTKFGRNCFIDVVEFEVDEPISKKRKTRSTRKSSTTKKSGSKTTKVSGSSSKTKKKESSNSKQKTSKTANKEK